MVAMTNMMMKGKLALPRAMKACRGSRGVASLILKRGARLRWWSTSRLGRFVPPPPPERIAGYRWTKGWVGPTAGLDGCRKRRSPAPAVIRAL